jgi:hypothetical protein
VPEGNFRPVPRDAERNYTYRLEYQGNAAPLPHEEMLVLRRWKGSPASYGLAMQRVLAASATHSFEEAVNLLTINTVTGASRWLFSGYSRRVISQEPIYAGGPQSPVSDPTQPHSNPIALVIHTVDADSNKDGELDSRDRQSLYVFRPNDNRAAKFFAADRVMLNSETDGGRLSRRL